jgi:hypothetical protein
LEFLHLGTLDDVTRSAPKAGSEAPGGATKRAPRFIANRNPLIMLPHLLAGGNLASFQDPIPFGSRLLEQKL